MNSVNRFILGRFQCAAHKGRHGRRRKRAATRSSARGRVVRARGTFVMVALGPIGGREAPDGALFDAVLTFVAQSRDIGRPQRNAWYRNQALKSITLRVNWLKSPFRAALFQRGGKQERCIVAGRPDRTRRQVCAIREVENWERQFQPTGSNRIPPPDADGPFGVATPIRSCASISIALAARVGVPPTQAGQT